MECDVDTEVQAQPLLNSWPENTEIHLNTALNALVLRSMDAGFWPIKSIQVGLNRATVNLPEALEELIQFDALNLITFGIKGAKEGDNADDLNQARQAVAQAYWPVLKVSSVMHRGLRDSHVQLRAVADLPLLESVSLSSIEKFDPFGKRDCMACEPILSVRAQGNWPVLKESRFPCSYFASHMRTELQPLFHRWPLFKVHHQCGIEENDRSIHVYYPQQ